MAQTSLKQLSADLHADVPFAAYDVAALSVQPFCAADELEVLAFLGARPLHTVIMAGLIRDNGLVSPLHRGMFYGCRDTHGRLLGVALIGHITQFETCHEPVMSAFAEHVRTYARVHMIMGEAEKVRSFWRYCAHAGQLSRTSCHELLFVQRQPCELHAPVANLRPATHADLELVAAAHAGLAESESGINPLAVDPAGFRARTTRRIAQGRVWVWLEDGRLIFKADVISETPAASYLEGVYVAEAARGRGYGLRCLSQLSRALLLRADVVCLLVNEHNYRAQMFYRRAGFKLYSRYQTIFLQAGL